MKCLTVFKLPIIFLFFSICLSSYSQSIVYKTEKVYDLKNVDSKPDFVGGMAAFYKFIAKNYKMPELEGKSGKVILDRKSVV